jgi:N-acetylglucosaminyldiphosphoundecaprenol N-acetyl-beta-D-mannosaminyltransferase
MGHAQRTVDFSARSVNSGASADLGSGAQTRADSSASSCTPDSALSSRRILGMRVDATSYASAAEEILQRAELGRGGMVCVSTVHMVMEGQDDPAFQKIVNAADLVTPDGVALVWALRWLGVSEATRVYGPTLTDQICARAARLGISVGFYGGTSAVLENLHAEVMRRHPGLQVTFRMSPPFRPLEPEEDAKVVEAIRSSGVGVLFVGLGCPKQERWMITHRESLSCGMVGVGAAFDFIAGEKAQAPAWLQRAGLEWLFRLICEPRRLWRRYLIHNPRFVRRLAAQIRRERGGRA